MLTTIFLTALVFDVLEAELFYLERDIVDYIPDFFCSIVRV